jgi:hypothetical protein
MPPSYGDPAVAGSHVGSHLSHLCLNRPDVSKNMNPAARRPRFNAKGWSRQESVRKGERPSGPAKTGQRGRGRKHHGKVVLCQVVLRTAGASALRHDRVCWDRLWQGKLAPVRRRECRSPVSGRSRPWHPRAAGVHAMVRQLGGRTDDGDRQLRAAPGLCPWRVAGPPWARAHPCRATDEFEPRGSRRRSS